MSGRLCVLTLVLLAAPVAASAQIVIELSRGGEVVERKVIETPRSTALQEPRELPAWVKGGGVPSDQIWVSPFRLDDTTGDSTFFSVRNARDDEFDAVALVTYFDENFTTLDAEAFMVLANETRVFNLRDHPELVDPGGVMTGFFSVEADSPLAVDVFQVDFSENFATGSRPPTLADFCFDWLVRFLTFGGDSGSRLSFILNAPTGVMSEEPSVEGRIYTQAGEFVNDFAIRTGLNLLEVDAADLVVGGAAFGSIEAEINVAFPTGYPGHLSVRHSAFGRFSVGHSALCTRAPMMPLSAAAHPVGE